MKKLLLLVVLLMLAGATSCKGNQTETLIDRVDSAIDHFIANYATRYLTESATGLTLEYHVVAGVKVLETAVMTLAWRIILPQTRWNWI